MKHQRTTQAAQQQGWAFTQFSNFQKHWAFLFLSILAQFVSPAFLFISDYYVRELEAWNSIKK